MEFHVLASGSKGNATFVYEDGCGILIDCGITRKQLLYKLEQLGFNDSDITYVFLTHDHYDHNKNIHIFDTDKIFSAKKNIENLDEYHTLIPYTHRQFGVFDVLTLKTSHDASDPIGFVISTDEQLLYMTDTGYVSQKNRQYMKNLDYYIIESNHDIEMLMATKRPMFLKNRILNDVGHLNNEYSAQLMSEMIGENTKEIILAHLSQEANTKEKAIETYKQVFKEHNIQFDQIKVASQVDVISGGKYED
ncbi:MAG: MBL fold metallo-hydrolase [Longibaculum muris]|uniref:Phosphoribosyl 1,2-cyclic phosphodiesterase n=1 Tax=Longibaculum muris TaxID=1796628 RepID=A0A4V2W5F4_9FIRM|nr:MBL fold metallo-hydrolase [Longibaculum muris]KXU42424.1 metallo-beta-lactamase domain protein [Candidatus Stoquefichus sp. KLE1796]MBS5368718.1 MBL fold metallo-hydrolase [Coprobacillus cateniformis]MCR1888748.1 MBL fold metallo-hydrolase [Longibaculum muris]MED9811222.1 MBL fold metallo-hydrolase [Longibaculum muris]TCV99592.1 phosphoribosyl 1,2-cyclic phosphodiesterase [Longibaculum muris]